MSSEAQEDRPVLAHTPLYDLHVALGGKMVPFAGYAMPVQYPAGIVAEHLHCRAQAALFDVSHMGQVRLTGDDAARRLETLVPGDILGLTAGDQRYTQLTNEAGGILDDLIVGRDQDGLFLVVNASRKAEDIAHMRAGLGDAVQLEALEDRALLALQGPQAAAVLGNLVPDCTALSFMQSGWFAIDGVDCRISRSGYSGEDGFEISTPADFAEPLARRLLAFEQVMPAGLGARDSLRLEAGLCLYGNDIDETTTPVEAALTWSIGKRRRSEGGFPGAQVIQKQLAEGVERKRVGLRPQGRAPVRGGSLLTDEAGNEVGTVTSGGFGPSVGAPVAMGYVASALAKVDQDLTAVVRGKGHPIAVAKLPFVPAGYHRG